MNLEQTARHDLTVAFRWAARLNMHEAVANHFSVATSDDGQKFLINPAGRHFSQMKMSYDSSWITPIPAALLNQMNTR